LFIEKISAVELLLKIFFKLIINRLSKINSPAAFWSKGLNSKFAYWSFKRILWIVW